MIGTKAVEVGRERKMAVVVYEDLPSRFDLEDPCDIIHIHRSL